jgi:hypothetical protein
MHADVTLAASIIYNIFNLCKSWLKGKSRINENSIKWKHAPGMPLQTVNGLFFMITSLKDVVLVVDPVLLSSGITLYVAMAVGNFSSADSRFRCNLSWPLTKKETTSRSRNKIRLPTYRKAQIRTRCLCKCSR